MQFERLYRKTVARLTEENCEFAVCGGLAAMIYRHEVRFTGDIDFLLGDFLLGARENLLELASSIIESFGFRVSLIRLSQLDLALRINKKQSPVAIVIGRDAKDKNAPGVDFLLPVQAWTKKALRRAKNNLISMHNVAAPFVTAEDILLAKLTALSFSGARREKDWSDVLSIFESGRKIDMAYLSAELEEMKISLPQPLEKQLPKAISTVLKRIRLSKC